MSNPGLLTLAVKYHAWAVAADIVNCIAKNISDEKMPEFMDLFRRLPLEVIMILQDESSVPYLRELSEKYIDSLVSSAENADYGN
jgi:indole-3-glycerol phosphate synthase